MNQNRIFTEGEGDAWFNRNQSQLQNIRQVENLSDVRYALDVLGPFSDRINRVLEIGCSNGLKLEFFCKRLNATGIGVEPSSIALKSGNDRNRTGEIELFGGTSDKLPPVCSDASFDLVYFAFCLYLVDRNTFLQSLAEADRVLKPGGFLVITDFDPKFGYKKPYSHFQGVYSYKQNYSSFYTQSGLYYLVGKHSFSHRQSCFDERSDERVSTNILYKEIDPYPTFEKL